MTFTKGPVKRLLDEGAEVHVTVPPSGVVHVRQTPGTRIAIRVLKEAPTEEAKQDTRQEID